MKLTHYFYLLLVLPLAACGPNPPAPAAAQDAVPAVDLNEAILGTWETVEVQTTEPTYLKQDTTLYRHIMEADWLNVYGVMPARTVFTPDGKLRRTHRMRDGQVTDIKNGLWKVQSADSLLIIEPNVTLYYAYELDNNLLTLTGKVDYDQDGEEDDDYRAVLRLVSRTQ